MSPMYTIWPEEGCSGAGMVEPRETLKSFFSSWGPEPTGRIQGICCDIWNPYVDTINSHAPHVVLVFDKFHIIRHLIDAFDAVRRDEISEKGKDHKELVKRLCRTIPETLVPAGNTLPPETYERLHVALTAQPKVYLELFRRAAH